MLAILNQFCNDSEFFHEFDTKPKYLRQGLIQSVFELHDGSGVVVTIGKYVTPHHMDINKNGIEPDFREFPGKFLDLVCGQNGNHQGPI